jgi:hypothetical protein
MAKLQTIDERNEELYNNPQSRFNNGTQTGTWGIQNPVAEYGTKNIPRGQVANDNYAPQARFNNNKRAFYEEQGEAANINAAPQQSITTGTGGETIAKVKLKSAKMRALILSPWIAGWWSFWWATVQIYASLAALLFLGASFAVTNNWFWDTVNKVWTLITELLGFQSPDLMTLCFIATGVSFGISLMNIGITWIVYKLAGIESMFGNTGSGIKTAIVLLVLIGGLPGLSLVPWYWIWIWAVTKYPQ